MSDLFDGDEEFDDDMDDGIEPEVHTGPPPPSGDAGGPPPVPPEAPPSGLQPPTSQPPGGGVSLPGLIHGSQPEKAEEAIKRMIAALGNIRIAAIGQTPALGWLLMKARDGSVIAMPTRPALDLFAHYYGITVFNMRPCEADGRPLVQVTRGMTQERTGYGGQVIPPRPFIQGELWGDGYCALLQQRIIGVRGVRRDTEKFVGRDDQDQDFVESVVTALRSKIIKKLSGIVRLRPEEVAAAMGLTVDEFTRRAVKGSGFGNADQRQTAQAHSENQPDAPINQAQATETWSEFWRRAIEDAGGDENAAWLKVQEAATFVKDGERVVPREPGAIAKSARWLASTIKTYNRTHKAGGR